MRGGSVSKYRSLDRTVLVADKERIVKELTTIEHFEACLADSSGSMAFIFKHSTACPISAAAHARVLQYIGDAQGNDLPPFYLVKVIESRPVSNEIAERLSVVHKSPQLILILDGKAAWSASHHGIHGEAISQALAKVAADR